MSSVYQVTEIEGKGLGCVAITDIEKGSLILTENPQVFVSTKEAEYSSNWIKSLLKSFKRMRKAEQLEYLALHNKYNNVQDSQNQFCKMLMEKDITHYANQYERHESKNRFVNPFETDSNIFIDMRFSKKYMTDGRPLEIF